MLLYFLVSFESVVAPLQPVLWQVPARRHERRVGALRIMRLPQDSRQVT
jgi:hypothetical protein